LLYFHQKVKSTSRICY